MNSSNQNVGSKRNHLVFAKYLLFPKIQIKYALLYTGIVFTAMATFMAAQYYLLGHGDQYNLNQENLDLIRMNLLSVNFVVLVMTSLICFLLSIVITHRFLGPTMGIKRTLESYKQDKIFRKISIRKTDEVKDLVDLLNMFFQDLEKKSEDATNEKK